MMGAAALSDYCPIFIPFQFPIFISLEQMVGSRLQLTTNQPVSSPPPKYNKIETKPPYRGLKTIYISHLFANSLGLSAGCICA